MNYKIIQDETALREFIDWLPELSPTETYYISLLSRKKYDSEVPSDKLSIKRVTSDKKYMFRKIKQMEVELGAYTAKADIPISEKSLALYISINPRDLEKAAKNLLIELARKITSPYDGYNPSSLALSETQKSCGTKHYFGFDHDQVDFTETYLQLEKVINTDCLEFIKTHSGFHTLVKLEKIDDKFKKSWYNEILKTKGCDVRGADMMSPVVGCTQGKHIPHFITGIH